MTQGIRGAFEPNAAMLDALADTPEEGEALYLIAKSRMAAAMRDGGGLE